MNGCFAWRKESIMKALEKSLGLSADLRFSVHYKDQIRQPAWLTHRYFRIKEIV